MRNAHLATFAKFKDEGHEEALGFLRILTLKDEPLKKIQSRYLDIAQSQDDSKPNLIQWLQLTQLYEEERHSHRH